MEEDVVAVKLFVPLLLAGLHSKYDGSGAQAMQNIQVATFCECQIGGGEDLLGIRVKEATLRTM